MSLDPKKLVDAIKMFQKKIEKQGRVTNARDEEHLERLLKLYKDMGGKKKFESVNEEKNNSENLNIEFGKVVQDFYNKCNQIADKITKLKGDKVDGKIVMKNVKKQVTPLIKLMHSWNKGQQKNPNLTTEAMDKRQAGETLKQLGGNKFIMMTGAKNFAVGPKGMGFKIGRNSKGVNYIRIDLDRGRDLYNMEFIQMRGGNLKVKSKVKGVYNDQLQKMFTKHTGMYTSLGTMGR